MAASTSGRHCGCTRPSECADRRDGRYLTAAYWLTREDSTRVSTSALGDRLNVTPATVTEMFQRLDASGLVEYRKHAGIRLTDHGLRIARELAWRQCAVRRFFAIELDFELDTDTGYRFGYVLAAPEIRTLRDLTDSDAESPPPSSSMHEPPCLAGVDETPR